MKAVTTASTAAYSANVSSHQDDVASAWVSTEIDAAAAAAADKAAFAARMKLVKDADAQTPTIWKN